MKSKFFGLKTFNKGDSRSIGIRTFVSWVFPQNCQPHFFNILAFIWLRVNKKH